jgi:NADH-quinone oxidoreductase subunit N
VVILVSRVGEERTSLRSYRGLGRRNPLLGGLLTLFLLSLAGIPGTAGFMAKVLVFGAAVDAGLEGLVIVAVLASVVAAYFYLRVIALAYMEEPEDELSVRTGAGPGWALAVAGVVTVALGVFPSLLLDPLQTAGILRW